jgi:putative tryptophan/tyrosine transport system substrate-binding protein
MMTATLALKRLELIRELLPKNATIGLLVNPDNQDSLLEIEDVARSTGQSLEVAKARNPDDLEPAFTQLVHAQVDAVLVSNDALFLASVSSLSHWPSVMRFPRPTNSASLRRSAA